MAKAKEFEIQTQTGRTATVQQIDKEWADHIRDKGFMGESPIEGNYFEYDAFGTGTYLVYDKDFVEGQIGFEDEFER